MKQKTKFKKTEIGIIPEEWEIDILDNFLDLITYGFTCPMPTTQEGPYMITAKDLEGNKINYIKARKTSKEAFKTKLTDKSRPKKGDILLSKDGTLGRLAIVENENLCISQSVALLRPSTKILTNFLYYLLLAPQYQKKMISDAGGSVLKHIYITRVNKMIIAVPELNEQRAIAKILSDLDAKIELLQKQNETLEKIGQVLFKHWFVDFEFPDEEGKPYKSSGGEMVYNEELGKEIPKGWGVGKLGDLLKNIKEHLKPGKDLIGRKYVPIDEIPMKKFGLDSYKPIEEAQSSLIAFEKGDILFGAMRPYFHRVNFSHFRGVTRTTTMVLRPIKKEFFSFSIFCLNQEDSVKYATQHSTGSTIPYATWEKSLERMKIIVPIDEILIKFNRLLIPFFNRIAENVEQIQTLQKIRDSLLPKLMSGKIRVPVEVKV